VEDIVRRFPRFLTGERIAHSICFVVTDAVTDRRPLVNGSLDRHCTLQRAAGIFAWAFGGAVLQLQSAFGVVALLAMAWAFGENRRAASLRQAFTGLVATVLTAVVLIKLPVSFLSNIRSKIAQPPVGTALFNPGQVDRPVAPALQALRVQSW
jgi:hypothetical protein